MENEWLSIECKHRRNLPQWILHAIDQAKADAKDYQLPIAVLHQVNSRLANDLVVMRWSDFVQWFGGVHGNLRNQELQK